jgi:DNA-binding Xre family transcriptional regulator
MHTLKEMRATKLLTIRSLAQKAGVAPSTVYLIENGKSTPRFSVIERLSTALEVQPSDIAEFAGAIRRASRSDS